MSKFKVGLIGLGTISDMHVHAVNACEGAEVSAICTRSEENLKRRAAQWGIGKTYSDYKELLADPDVDAVIISTPPNLHAPMTIDALNAGKHVLCEKPPALNAAQAKEMMECAEKNGKLLMYGLMFRFSRKHNFVADLREKGHLGEVYLAKGGIVRRSDYHGGWFTSKAIAGGGSLMDYGPHIVDLSIRLMGEPVPKTVFARTFRKTENLADVKLHEVGAYRPIDPTRMENDIEELDLMMVNFENGACLQIETSFMSHIKEDTMWISLYGSKGGMQVDPDMELYTVMDQYLVDVKPRVDCVSFEYQNSVDAEFANFYAASLGREACLVPASVGYRLMAIFDAAYESAATGKSVDVVL